MDDRRWAGDRGNVCSELGRLWVNVASVFFMSSSICGLTGESRVCS